MDVSIHNKAGGERKEIDLLEGEIDEAVYDLFNLDERELEVVEVYLEAL